jgi:hypothetical protein
MKKLIYLALIPFLVFVSCSDELDESSAAKKGRAPADSRYPSYFSIARVSENGPATKAGVPIPEELAAKWNDFDIIKIYFMNGTGNTALINKVKAVAGTYEELTNLRFRYVTDPSISDVRITFSNHEAAPELNYLVANWSYLGKQCLTVAKSEPTMNLAIADINDLMEVNSPTFRASILREFGHMIGMIYEYQRYHPTNPDERVVLDEGSVLDGIGVALEDTLGERQIIEAYTKYRFYLDELIVADTISPTVDEQSVMLPYIPDDWIVTTGRIKTSAMMFDKIHEKVNLDLSARDSAYIKRIYPVPPPPTHPQGPKGNITISLGPTSYYEGWVTGDYRVGWDYRTGAYDARIINDYPTIGVGEYEWTTVNLRIKYQGYSIGTYLNFDNTMVNFLAGSAFGNDANTVNEFEKIFGTWATEYADAEHFHYATSYRDSDAEYTRNDTQYPSANVAFDLPDVTAILQLFGQMPHTSYGVYKDFRNYAFGLPDSTDTQLAAALAQEMPFLNGDFNANLSGLSLVPLGSMHSHGEADVPYIYTTHPNAVNNPYADWHGNAFMTTGTGVKLKMKISGGAQQRNFNFHESGNNDKEIILNQYLFHWGSARYCRAIPDAELGYRLYVDESSDKVVYLPLGEQPETGYVELPRGIQRGVALSNLYIDADNGIYYFRKSWSKIQQEATSILYNIGISN